MYSELIEFIKTLYPDKETIVLHEPLFSDLEKQYVNRCLDSTFVSSVGVYVNQFEKMICDYTKSAHAIATTNGTSALHMALILSGVQKEDEVLTQSLSFIATANAIMYCHAHPIFVDSAEDNLGLSPRSLKKFFEDHAELKADGFCYNKKSGRRIKACVPMHVFGHPVDLDAILAVCERYNVSVVEDAAESLGSFYKGHHTGTIAPIGTLSFNGNKVVTCGGGGMLLIQDAELAKRAKHLTTTAKVPHPYEFYHDEVGYNYRLPNLNAALACAQMERLPGFLQSKRETAMGYKNFLKGQKLKFLDEPSFGRSNFWLNAVICESPEQRNQLLAESHSKGVMTRPVWALMHRLPMYKDCQRTEMKNAEYFEARVVNLPSSARE
jgi:aminotransferase in exopolysaccharide biosynthesis